MDQINNSIASCFHGNKVSLFCLHLYTMTETKLTAEDLEEIDFSDITDNDLKQEMQDLLERHRQECLLTQKGGLGEFELTVTIKFVLNTGERYTAAFGYMDKFGDIKEKLASTFQVPKKVISLYKEEGEILDEETPQGLNAEPFDTIEVRLVSLEGNQWPLRSSQLNLPTPDILTVFVGDEKEVVVEIEDHSIRKPFLGGFRNKLKDTVYHNASTQFTPLKPYKEKFTRDTQTAAFSHKSTETVCEKTTQSSEKNFFYDYERVLTPGPYCPVVIPSPQSESNMEEAAKCIQRSFRAFLLRKRLSAIIASKWEEKKRDEEKEEKRQNQDVRRMTYPRTKADFDMLYAMVERWRRAQTERIAKIKTEAPKKAELCQVLEKEVKLLESIEAHRIRRLEEKRKEREKRFLHHASQPVTWVGYRGLIVSMDTIRTQRARELVAMYDELADNTDPSVRVEKLIALKHAITTQDNPAANELIELIDREVELLARAVPTTQLRFLRARIQQLFFRYFQESETTQPPIEPHIYCRLCCRMRGNREFSIAARDTAVAVCSGCRLSRGNAQDYRHILRAVRRDEQRRGCYSSCAFVMTEEDMEFLVSSVWHGRSAVSSVEELRILRLPRWNVSQDWTPWNCVLLTERETRAHLHVPTKLQFAEHILRDIAAKHELAKQHFVQLQEVDARFQNSGIWANVKDNPHV